MLGSVRTNGEVSDSLNAFVYYQSPPHDGVSSIRMGEAVDVYITPDRPYVD